MSTKVLRVNAIFEATDRIVKPVSRMTKNVMRFTRSMKRGLQSVDRVTSRVARGMGSAVQKGAAVMVVALTAVGLAVNKVADDLDTLSKRSNRLDFDIESLQEWKFVADQAGVGADAFSKSLDKFAKRLGEANSGFGSLFSGLKASNPELLKQLMATDDVAEALELYVAALAKTPGAANKAAMASMGFGRSGTEMINMASLGAEEIKNLRAEMRENGVVTLEQAQAAEVYNDSMSSLKRALGSFMQNILVPLMPLLIQAIQAVRAWAVANKKIISSKILEFGQGIVDNWQKIVHWVKQIGKGIAVFFALTLALKALIGVLTVINIVMAANPIGLIVIAVAAVVAAIAAAVVWGEELKAMFDELPQPMKQLVAIALFLMGPIGWLVTAAVLIRTHWEELKVFFIEFAKVAKQAFKDVVEFAKDASVAVQNAWLDTKNFFIDLWNSIIETFENAVNYLMLNGPISWILYAVALIKRDWEPISEFFRAIWENVIAVFENYVGLYKATWGPIKSYYVTIWDAVVGKTAWASDRIQNSPIVKGIVDAIKIAWGTLVDFFKSIWDKVLQVVDIAVGKLKQVMQPALNLIQDVVDAKNAIIGEEIGAVDLDRVDRDESPPVTREPSIVTPQARTAKSIEEHRETSTSEVTIKDETGRAEVTKGTPAPGIKLIPSGAF